MSLAPARLPFHVSANEGGTTVRFTAGPALTEADIEALTRRLPGLVVGHAPLTLDLCGVAALSSGALGKLLGLNRAIRAAEGRLVLVNPMPAVSRVLRITRLDTILDVRAAESLAV